MMYPAPARGQPRRARTTAVWFLGSLAALGAACGQESGDGAGASGRVALALQVAPGVSLSNASYTVTGPNAFMSSGSVGVGQTSDVPIVLNGLPSGSGYLLSVTGTASDGVTTCSGSAPFEVSGGMTSTVIVHVVCRRGMAGAIDLSGTADLCPVLEGISVYPASVKVGGSVSLTAGVHDSDLGPGPLTVAWAASAGSWTGSSPAVAFPCTSVGMVTVTATASDGYAVCDDSLSATINCVAP